MGAGGEAGGCEARLSAALARTRFEDLPDAVVQHAVRGIVNAAACVLAGREDPAVQNPRAQRFPAKTRCSTPPRPPRTTTTILISRR